MDQPLRPGATDSSENLFGQPPKDLPRHHPAPPSRCMDRSGVRLDRIDMASRRDRALFLEVADLIQRGDPDYIAPLRMERMRFLDPKKNPAFQQLEVMALIARRPDGRLAGRITAHVDRTYNEYNKVNVAWFGFFESVDDVHVAHALLAEATDWAKARGATEIIGPCNFTTNHQVGLLVENFDRPPFVEMTYNPPWYEDLIKSYGYGKAKDLLVWWIDASKGTDDPKMKRYFEASEKARQRYGLKIRTLDMARWKDEVRLVFDVYNLCWAQNWGFVPFTKAEFEAVSEDLRSIIDPAIVLCVEDKNGRAVGFSLSVPNYNEIMPRNGRLFPLGWWSLLMGRRRIKWARLMVLGVIPEYRKKGVEAMLSIQTALRARDRGMLGGEIGWILEDNIPINRTIESFGGRLDRRYRLFGMDLT